MITTIHRLAKKLNCTKSNIGQYFYITLKDCQTGICSIAFAPSVIQFM